MARSILKISGDDRMSFLQGLITNDVNKLSDGLVYAALLSPQGKYLADFILVPWQNAILLDVDAGLAPALSQRLTMYKLRADVAIEAIDLNVHRGLGECPDDGFLDPRDPDLGWRAYRSDVQAGDTVDWDRLFVEKMVPSAGTELIANESYILEMGFERLNGVDFKKGCYVGQEVTARMKHKTELRKGLATVRIEGTATSGDDITSNGKQVGHLGKIAGSIGLAYLRFDRAGEDMVGGSARIFRMS